MKYSKDVKKVLVIVIPICAILTGLFIFIRTNVIDLKDNLKDGDVEEVFITEEAKNNQTQLLVYLGESYEDKGEFDKAIEAYKYALDNEPKAAWVWDRLSFFYIKTGNFDEALFAREKATELDAEDASAYFHYAQILLLYDVEEAILATDKYYDLSIKSGESGIEYSEKVNKAYKDFQERYRSGNLYSAYTKLFNSEIYIQDAIKVELLTRLIESSTLSSKELKEIEAIKANLEKSIAEGI
ncbi:tetratricopeptide repeat protein [Alloiococcus sp. CFN-8]|uniref:tetratricopeptide repeat protein n=1 Tax=Alloiococcus sp. CFN-8 TaxID=3416081 RepID=UPI003CF6F88C